MTDAPIPDKDREAAELIDLACAAIKSHGAWVKGRVRAGIDAARLDGIRLGIEAAAKYHDKEVATCDRTLLGVRDSSYYETVADSRDNHMASAHNIRALSPTKETDHE